MATRQNFSEQQRQSAFAANAMWLRDHRVTGVELALAFEPLRHRAQVYYCENCLFCHSDQAYFDIDHLVPDRSFRIWQKHVDARDPINMVVLCKSTERGERGCNQSKGANLFVPVERGLAYSRQDLDMNCFRLGERPHEYQVPV
jgi:hypothetical protein